MMPLAILGGAVSPVTSYLALHRGPRRDRGHGPHRPRRGGGTGSGFGRGSGAGFGRRDTRMKFLQQAVRESLDACGGPGRGVHVELESTLDELVEISAVRISGPADPVLPVCLEQQLWDVPLRVDFDDEWRRWVVELPEA